MFMFMGKRTLYFRHFRLDEAAETVFLTSEGQGRPQSFTQAAPNELKRGKIGTQWLELAIGLAVASGGETETKGAGLTVRRAHVRARA